MYYSLVTVPQSNYIFNFISHPTRTGNIYSMCKVCVVCRHKSDHKRNVFDHSIDTINVPS